MLNTLMIHKNEIELPIKHIVYWSFGKMQNYFMRMNEANTKVESKSY